MQYADNYVFHLLWAYKNETKHTGNLDLFITS